MIRYALDIEVYPNYFLVVISRFKLNEISRNKYSYMLEETFSFQLYKDRGKTSLAKMRKFIAQNFMGNEVYTYNGIQYDFPVLKYVYETPDVSNEDIFEYSQQVIEDRSLREVNLWGCAHIDLMELLNPKKSLKKTLAVLGYKEILDLPYHWATELSPKEQKAVAKYCLVDVEGTVFLATHAQSELMTRRALMEHRYPDLDLLTYGRPRVANKCQTYWYKKMTGNNPYTLKKRYWGADNSDIYNKLARTTFDFGKIVPDVFIMKHPDIYNFYRELRAFKRLGWYGDGKTTKENKFKRKVSIAGKYYSLGEGGIHDDFGAGYYEECDEYGVCNIDAASFYPMIRVVFQTDPLHCPDLWKVILDDIAFRIIHKKKRKESETSNLIQGAQKIVINSGFGHTGSMFSPFYAPGRSMLGVTLVGQVLLLQMIDFLIGWPEEDMGIEVIAANTDGICIRYKKSSRDFIERAVKKWEDSFKIEMEIVDLKKFVKLNANSYLEIDTNGDIEKGVKDFRTYIPVDKGRSNLIIAKALVAYYHEGTPIETTIKESRNIHDFITVVSCGQNAQNYYAIDGCTHGRLQKTLRYYHAKRGGDLSVLRANAKNPSQYPNATSVRVALNIPDPDIKNYFDIDYEWYINETQSVINKISNGDSHVSVEDASHEEYVSDSLQLV